MREIVARAFTESNQMTLEELKLVIQEYDLIPAHERTFEEKMGQNLASDLIKSAARYEKEKLQKDEEVKQEEKIADLEARLAALEKKEK